MEEAWRFIWAKKDEEREGQMWHPLIFHMLDTAGVAMALHDHVFSRSQRQRLADNLGLSDEQVCRYIAFLVSLHDLGKASPIFQGRWDRAKIRLQEKGLCFPQSLASTPHGVISAYALRRVFKSWGWIPKKGKQLAVVLGGHHGVYPSADEIIGVGTLDGGGEVWDETREGLWRMVSEVLDIRPELYGHRFEPTAPFLLCLSGITTVADWIASDANLFPYQITQSRSDLPDYWKETRNKASTALSCLGWTGWMSSQGPRTFVETFPWITRPRPLQEAVAGVSEIISSTPSLVLIEAPMGEGKTEAAFYLADQWQINVGQRGCYIALPTQATSNQMFERYRQFLSSRYPEDRVNLHLLHGQSELSPAYRALRLKGVEAEAVETGRVVAEEWFLPKKRALLSPFGVGTIDQALLGVLRVRHGYLRLYGLADKVVVVDEVHAYDTYTSSLIEGMLRWLGALGTSVVLLSATLPSQKRRHLLKAYSGTELVDDSPLYPRITWVNPVGQGSVSFAAKEWPDLHLQWVGPEPEAIAEALVSVLDQGGVAAWICNTVDRAQQTYLQLEPLARSMGIELILFHARYPWRLRAEIEEEVLRRFGPGNDQRPCRAIVVATQVIEQSLDLDFDVMITDLAPVDLVLQRSGRLHRHRRQRPLRLLDRNLWLVSPGMREDRTPEFGPNAAVYSEHILLRSWLALRDLMTVSVPGDMESLIESVYGTTDDAGFTVSPHLRERLREAGCKDRQQASLESYMAESKVLPDPEDGFLDSLWLDLEEDQPGMHANLRAMTRLGDESIRFICLHEVKGGVSLDRSGDVIDVNDLNREVIDGLVRNSVTLSHGGVVCQARSIEPPGSWKRSSVLRHMIPLVFVDGVASVGKWLIELDPKLGIRIERR